MIKKSIESIVKENLCTGCGTCIACCPRRALSITLDNDAGIYVPEINTGLCNDCGVCLSVCPGQEVDFPLLNQTFFGRNPTDQLIGNYIYTSIGHATNYDIRYNATSGGIVTQLLLFALDEGIIDGALVTRMHRDSPFEPEPFIARTRKEIIEASRSKYCPVPANIALKDILKSEDGERFAIVGLPCHLQAIRKLEMQNHKLMKKIVLHIGIVCNHTPNFHATDFIISRLAINKEDIVQLSYRGGGWPGGMKIELKSGLSLSLSLSGYWGSGFGQGFVPHRCTLCYDHMAEFSDVSFADAWIPEVQKSDPIGTSLIICRSQNGFKILESMRSRELIEMKNIDPEQAAETQRASLKFKKRGLNARMNLLKLLNKKTPCYTVYERIPSSWRDYVFGLSLYSKLFLYSKKPLWSLLYFTINSKKRVLGIFIHRNQQKVDK